jgi:PAS domain S-box-containing protein
MAGSGSLQQLDHVSRMLRAIRNVNRLIVREKDPQLLIRQACETLVETRGCLGAWIALAGADGAPGQWAEAGWGASFAPVKALLGQRRWPPCYDQVAHEERAAVLDARKACPDCPMWGPCAGRKPVLTLLRHAGHVYGQLALSFPEGFAFDEQERDLVDEVAADLAFALHAAAVEDERRRADREKLEAAQELSERARLTEQSNALLLELAAVPAGEDPRGLVTRGLRRITGAKVAAFSSYDPHEKTLTVHGLDMEPGFLAKVVSLLGRRLEDLTMPVSDQEYAEIVGHIVGYRRTFTEATFGAVHPVAGALAQKLVGVDRFVGLAHVIDGRLYGTSVLALAPEQADPPADWLTSVAHMVAITLRRRLAEAALSDSESRYRTLFDESPTGMLLLDETGNVLEANKCWFKIVGAEPTELLRKNALSVAAADERSGLDIAALRADLEARLEGSSGFTELTFRKCSGECATVAVHSVPFGAPGGARQLLYLFGDVTERKRAERELRESEERFRLLLEHLPAGVVVHDAQARVTFANQQACATLGLSLDQMKGKLAADPAWSFARADGSLMPVEEYPVQRVLATRKPVRGLEIGVCLPTSGERSWAIVNAFPELEGDAVRQVVVTFVDINERKFAELAMAESEQRFRQVFETAPMPLALFPRDGSFMECNRQFHELFGYTKQDLPSLDDFQRLAFPDPEFRRVAQEWSRALFESGEVAVRFAPVERYITCKDGRGLTGLFYGSRSGDTVLAAFVDLTDSKRAEKQVHAAHLKLQRILDNLQDFYLQADLEGHLSMVSPSAVRAYRFASAAEMLRAPGQDFYADLADRARLHQELRENGRALGVVLQARRKDGSTFWVSVNAQFIRDGTGNAVGVEMMIRDITEQRAAEERVRLQSEMLDEAPVGIVVYDSDGRFLYANRSAAKDHDYQAEEFLKLELDALLSGAGRLAWQERFEEIFSGEGLAFDVEHMRRDGSALPLHVQAREVRWRGERAILAVHTDLTERKRAEASLEDVNRRFRTIVDSNLVGVVVARSDGRIVEANDYYLGLVGATREELERGEVDWRRLTPPAWLPADERALGELRERGACAPYEKEYQRRDGSRVSVLLADAMLPGPEEAIVAVALDLTARKRVEHELRDAHGKLQRILDNLQDAYFQAGLDGRITVASPSAARMYGYGSKVEMLGLDETCVYADLEDRKVVLEHLWASGRVSDYLIRGRRKDGSTFWASLNAQPWLDERGQQGGTEAIVRDVTERVLADERNKLLSEMLDEAPTGILVHDAERRILYANQNAARLHGYAVEDFAGLRLDDLASAADLGRQVARMGEIDREGEAAFEVLHLRKDGSELPLHVHARKVLWQGCPAYMKVQTDLTERKRTEEERRKLQASLAQSDRLASMGMLAAGVAHEINNPLAYSLYNLESLSADLARHAKQLTAVRMALSSSRLAGAVREVLGADAGALESLTPATWFDVMDRFKDALAGNRKIKEIARGLGTFSRVEEDQLGAVDLRDPIESALSIASNEIKYRARVERDFGTTAPVTGSEGRLSQVFLNLFINAAHAIHEGDVERNRIRVRTWQESGMIHAEVRDTGCGIPAENLARIFDPFFTTKPVGVGSGLGLSIVRSIVSGYGGTIEVSSEVGEGTRFLIRLPAVENAQAPVVEETGRSSEQAEVHGRILVIDDDPGLRAALHRILKRHDVVEADSGEKGCEILGADPHFDVILCDMMMPRMSGMDLHKWLVEHNPNLAKRVVFVTGGAFTPAAREYLTKVGNLRVEKPFDGTNLRKMVAEWVRTAKASAS